MSLSVQYSNQVSTQDFSVFSQCQPCASQCLTCTDSSSNCQSCPDNLYFFSGSCLDTCPDSTFNLNGICTSCPPSCVRCADQSTCFACVSGAVLFNGDCRSSCPQGFFIESWSTSTELLSYNCTPCSSSCKTCNGNSEYDCLSCN